MPYYAYRVTNDRATATLLQEFDTFKSASQFAKEQRSAADAPENTFVKVVHAGDTLEAERLVTEFRQPKWPVEEWE